ALRYSITSCCSPAIQRMSAASIRCSGTIRESLSDRCPTTILDSFMKRLCQVTLLVERELGLSRQTSSERAQPSHPAKRDGCANGSHVVTFVVKRRTLTSPWRGGSPFYARSAWHRICRRTIRIRRSSRAVYGTALRSGHLSKRADSSSLTTSHP